MDGGKALLRHAGKCVAICCAIIASAFSIQAQLVFTPPQNISNSPQLSQNQQIAVDSKGNIDVVWQERDTSITTNNGAIYFGHSVDGGSTFSSPLLISTESTNAANPHVLVDKDGVIYVTWSDATSPSTAYLSRSLDNGATFSPPRSLSLGTQSTQPTLVLDSSAGLDLAWSDNLPGYFAIFYARSTDQGVTFPNPTQVTNNSLGSFSALEDVDSNGNIYLAWAGPSPTFPTTSTNVFFSLSTDGGATFSSPTNVSPIDPRIHATPAHISADSPTNIYVGAMVLPPCCSLQSYVGVVHSHDGGATFDSVIQAGGGEFIPKFSAALDSTGAINLVWSSSGGNGQALINFFRWNGTVLSNRVLETTIANNTPALQMALDSQNNINVMMGPPTGSDDLLFVRSTAGGNSFSAQQSVSASSGADDVELATSAVGDVYATWLVSVANFNDDVFFSRSISLSSVAISPSAIVGGGTTTGTVALSGPAPAGGVTVTLASDNAAATVPASVAVAAEATSATFAIMTSQVSTSTPITISATFGGVTQSATLTVRPPALTSLALNPIAVTGGNSSTGTVSLDGPAGTNGAVVALSSSDPAAGVPSAVTIAPGATSANFAVTTTAVSASASATISATFSGVTVTAPLTINPPSLTSITLNPPEVTGVQFITAAVSLDGAAPSGGATVALSSSVFGAVLMRPDVTIPAGASSTTFTILTLPAFSTENVTISASYKNVTQTALLTIRPIVAPSGRGDFGFFRRF